MGDMEYTEQHTFIQPHTTIFMYTDGLTEAEDVDFSQFGDKRMRMVAEQMVAEGDEWQQPGALVKKMEKTVTAFVGRAEQSDDLTMLAVSYLKSS
jgi:sigma-B regulation protein RsbU (phosphoserine phosphatase)